MRAVRSSRQTTDMIERDLSLAVWAGGEVGLGGLEGDADRQLFPGLQPLGYTMPTMLTNLTPGSAHVMGGIRKPWEVDDSRSPYTELLLCSSITISYDLYKCVRALHMILID